MSTASPPVISITSAALNVISSEAPRSMDGLETGGILLGTDTLEGICIRHAGSPGPNARRSSVTFLRATSTMRNSSLKPHGGRIAVNGWGSGTPTRGQTSPPAAWISTPTYDTFGIVIYGSIISWRSLSLFYRTAASAQLPGSSTATGFARFTCRLTEPVLGKAKGRGIVSNQ